MKQCIVNGSVVLSVVHRSYLDTLHHVIFIGLLTAIRESSESRLTKNIASSSRNFLALKCYCKIVEVVLTTSSAYIFWEGKLVS